MSLNLAELRHDVDRVLREIEIEHQHIQGMILTEDDLKCVLYKKLTEIASLSCPEPTQDLHIRANKVHSELSWYDENKRLTIRPDITILGPKDLSILHQIRGDTYVYLKEIDQTQLYKDQPLSTKQFSFGGKAIIIELKFIRNKGGIYRSTMPRLIADYEKLMRLFRLLDSKGRGNEVFGYIIILNKTNKQCQDFQEFLQESGQSDRHKIVYMTGNVEFP